jgi:hypothetical protein
MEDSPIPATHYSWQRLYYHTGMRQGDSDERHTPSLFDAGFVEDMATSAWMVIYVLGGGGIHDLECFTDIVTCGCVSRCGCGLFDGAFWSSIHVACGFEAETSMIIDRDDINIFWHDTNLPNARY